MDNGVEGMEMSIVFEWHKRFEEARM